MIVAARLYGLATVACFAMAALLPIWYLWHATVVWSILGLFARAACIEEMRVARRRVDHRRLREIDRRVSELFS